ncbi:SAV_6107 family HEPN domain-containing protein [Amycolatopsis sp. CA-230715]|uniref:SAV_6107 family HEPN domain-containing protein n=1 Tax=Amycolatopsis sp. CA-230715 TaxID=2745196 RepID=UPI0020B21CAB|nr:SAV_6107 family HEPN domain-containing protein [Amycolatopsis sp. CA-230715]
MPEANTQAADGRQCALPLGPVPHAMPLDAFAAPITRRGPRITKSRTSGRQGVLPVTELVATAPFVGPSRPSRPVPRAGTAPEPSHPARAEHGGRHGRPAPLALTPVTGAAADGETGPAPARENGIPVGPAAEDAALAPAPGSHGSPAGEESARAGSATQPELPMPVGPPVAPAAITLLAQARRGLVEAESEASPAPRFIAAYLAALRAAAAVLAARGRPHRGRAKPASVWLLLDSTVPELAEWAGFFAAHSATQAAAQAGITRKVTANLADDLLAQVARFVELAKHAVHHHDEPAAEFDVPAQRRGVCATPPVGAPKNRRG